MKKLETILGSVVILGSVYLIHNAYRQNKEKGMMTINEVNEYVEIIKGLYKEAITW